jgi:hypothetical protein
VTKKLVLRLLKLKQGAPEMACTRNALALQEAALLGVGRQYYKSLICNWLIVKSNIRNAIG